MVSNSLLIQTLTIPDELLAWARQSEIRIRMRVDYAQQFEDLLSDNETLGMNETNRLLNLLEGLCCEAVLHERDDLLTGFDIFTAEWIGLHYTLSDKITVGRNGTWTWDELRKVLACQTPRDAMLAAMRAKDLVSDVFPESRIDAIIDAETAKPVCTGCGMANSSVVLTMESGSEYCSPCWSAMIENHKPVVAAKKRTRRQPAAVSSAVLFGDDEGQR